MRKIAFTSVRKPYGWLGNMSSYPIVYAGLTWPTAEALFQALRFSEDNPIREVIRSQRSPMSAKMIAKANAAEMVVTPRSPEDLRNMRTVLRIKIDTHPEIRNGLLELGDDEIIEDCTKRPFGSGPFWGAFRQDEDWIGENILGKLWMEERARLRGETLHLVPVPPCQCQLEIGDSPCPRHDCPHGTHPSDCEQCGSPGQNGLQ